MSGLLRRLLAFRRREAISYEESKRLSASHDPADRRRVACNGGVGPELLYFLAGDPDPSVRAAVAANAATPAQADLLLARDRDEAVRGDLARKIARLAPGLGPRETDRLRRATWEALELLVRDEIARVRGIIAEALKDVANAPPEIIQRLARDQEIAVAGPVLRFSPVLSDADLIEIIGGSPIAGACEAVARRRGLGGGPAEAIAHCGSEAAIAALLANPSAQIHEETLDRLVERAVEVPSWHAPLVARPRLSGAAIRKLAGIVAADLLDRLRRRSDLDPATAREVAAVVMRRLAEERPGDAEEAAAESGPEAALRRAQRLKSEGKLDDEAVMRALRDGDRAFAMAALALRAELPQAAVENIIAAQSAKGMVALAWRAGMAMRCAIRLQLALGRIAPASVIEPRPDGGYPLAEEAMRWQLEFLTGGAR